MPKTHTKATGGRAGQVRLVGRGALPRMFPRTDHDIAAYVTELVLRDALDATPGTVSADVMDGVVVLRGRVARRSVVPAALALTRTVTGVIDVIEHLTYDIDDTVFVPDIAPTVAVPPLAL